MHYKFKHYKLRTRRFARSMEKRYRNHPRIVPMLAAAAVLLIAFILAITLRDSAITLNKSEANIVVLHADRKTSVLPTRADTVGEFLEKADITLNDGDVVEPGLDTKIREDDFRVNVYRATPVVIHDEAKRIVAFSAAQTSRSIVAQAGLSVFPEDILVTEPSTNFLRDGIGHKVTIERSLPVNLNLYGSALALRTHAKTVGELLAEKNVKLGEDDSVQPSVDTILEDQTQVFVTRFGTQVVSIEESIAMPVETINDNSLSFGAVAVRQQGSAGKKSVTYELEMENGVEVGRRLIQEVIVTEPVKQIIARGTLVNIPGDKTAVLNAAGIPPSQHAYANYIFSRESTWNAAAISSNQCIGLGQNCPDKYGNYWLKEACPNWQNDPVCQARRFTGYASRYGGWEGAYYFWLDHHWW